MSRTGALRRDQHDNHGRIILMRILKMLMGEPRRVERKAQRAMRLQAMLATRRAGDVPPLTPILSCYRFSPWR
jgi:hypothetical protein